MECNIYKLPESCPYAVIVNSALSLILAVAFDQDFSWLGFL